MLLDLKVESGIYEVNYAKIKMVAHKDIFPEMGEKVTIKLGNKETNLVFTGKVKTVKANLQSMEIFAESSLSNLVKIRTNELYEQQRSGSIVRSFADQGDMTTGLIELLPIKSI